MLRIFVLSINLPWSCGLCNIIDLFNLLTSLARCINCFNIAKAIGHCSFKAITKNKLFKIEAPLLLLTPVCLSKCVSCVKLTPRKNSARLGCFHISARCYPFWPEPFWSFISSVSDRWFPFWREFLMWFIENNKFDFHWTELHLRVGTFECK